MADAPGDSQDPPVGQGKKARPVPWPVRLRRAHGALAPLVVAPLLVTVSTGLSYRVLRDWGGVGRDAAHGLMELHEGAWLTPWLGTNGETLYVLLNALGLLWMLTTGSALVWERLRRSWGGRAPGGDS